MIFSQTAEYALRAMAHLANLPTGQAARARDVAAATGIPEAYAAKVLRRLVEAQLVSGRKGHGGGFELARPPERIRFNEILVAAAEPLFENRCAFGWGTCSGERPCVLHPTWSVLKEQVQSWAYDTSLADVVKGRAGIPGSGLERKKR